MRARQSPRVRPGFDPRHLSKWLAASPPWCRWPFSGYIGFWLCKNMSGAGCFLPIPTRIVLPFPHVIDGKPDLPCISRL